MEYRVPRIIFRQGEMAGARPDRVQELGRIEVGVKVDDHLGFSVE